MTTATLTTPPTVPAQPEPPPEHIRWALAYAAAGYHVFPVHNPIFDAQGHCTGCTCEHYRRSEDCRRDHPHLYLGAEGHCDNPGKCPRVQWRAKSTTDPDQIRKWWGKPWRDLDPNTGRTLWSLPNIGIDDGKSGTLILDADLYKEHYAGDGMGMEDATVSSLTGGGGRHVWYRMPLGKAYGNATGGLPAGIDIRGAGGYHVAPPSLHKSGRRYVFAPGHSPRDMELATVPAALQTLLDAAPQNNRAALGPADSAAVERSAGTVRALVDHAQLAAVEQEWRTAGELGRRWVLADCPFSDAHRDGAFIVVTPDGTIGAGCHHASCQARIQDEGGSGWKLLRRLAGFTPAQDAPIADPQLLAKFAAARAWVSGPECPVYLRAVGIRRVAEYLPTLDALLEWAGERATLHPVVTMRGLAERTAAAPMTVSRHLARLVEARLVATTPGETGTLIDLEPLIQLVLSVTPLPVIGEGVTLRTTSAAADFLTEHRADDAFTSYPYPYAQRRRGIPIVLLPALGAGGRMLWPALAAGGGTVSELATMTGLTDGAVRTTLRKFAAAGLLFAYQVGRATCYELHPNADEMLDDLRQHMTSWGIGQLRTARANAEQATYAHRQLARPLGDRERARLEQRRDKCDALAAAAHAMLEQSGINPRARVTSRPPRVRALRIDPLAEWDRMAPTWAAWQDLGDLPRGERYRLLEMAGYTRRDIDEARHMAPRAGHAPRRFLGVDTLAAAAV